MVSEDLAPGAYYVLVSGEPGPYAVNVRLADALDHGAAFEASTLLKLHTEEDLAGVSPQVLLATSGRIHPDTDDTDTFRLDVTGEAADVTVRASGGVDTYATLYRPDGTELAFSDNGTANFNINMPLAGGIYYVAVKGHGTGAYRVLASGKPTDETPGTTLMLPAPRFHDETATGLNVSWDWTFAPLEQVSFDFQGRIEGMDIWPIQACFALANPRNEELRDTITAVLTQLEPDTTYEARYRFRDTRECFSATGPDSLWSAIGSGTTLPPDTTSSDEYCRDGDTIDAGNECSLYDTPLVFEARTNGTGCLVGGGLLSCAGNRHNIRDSTINGIQVTFVAERNDDDSWTIEDVEPEPEDGESVSLNARRAVRQ
ncbi:MAG: hypothetical protein OXH15_07580 [Gammaproteobacteria bacterium]|nr:hypothetical protein [Gammaproteobacteria bacterium]